MKCPSCGSDDLAVQDSRPTEGAIKRRRLCAGCGARWVSLETITEPYQPGRPGRPVDADAPPKKPKKERKPKVVKVKERVAARRRIEDLMDEREDYSMWDDLADAASEGLRWKD